MEEILNKMLTMVSKAVEYIEDEYRMKSISKLALCKEECPQASPTKAEGTIGNKPMRYRYDEEFDTADSAADRKASYLEGRLDSVRYGLRLKLERQFAISDEEEPTSVEDLLDRIQKGRYTVVAKEERSHWHSPIRNIKWRDPAAVKDIEGFQKAEKTLDAEIVKVRDVIQILTPEAGLSAIQALENWTYSGNA